MFTETPGSTEARHRLVSASLEYLEGLSSGARGDLDLAQEIGEAYERAKLILMEHRVSLDRLAAALLDRETLDRDEIELVVSGKPLPPLPPTAGAVPARERPAPVPQPAPVPVLGSPPPEPAWA